MAYPDVNDQPCLDDVDIRRQLDRILAYPEFQASDRRRDLLRYIVEEALAGRPSQIKATTIAMAVFDRGPDFDQQSDPVVRLEARKLRRDLDNYYAGAGRDDPILIAVPKGGYVPVFSPVIGARADQDVPQETVDTGIPGQATAPEPAYGGWRSRTVFWHAALTVTVIALLVGALVWVTRPEEQGEVVALAMPSRGVTILVEDFELGSVDELATLLAQGLTHAVAAALIRFQDLRIFRASAQGSPGAGSPSIEEISRQVKFVVAGSVWREADDLFVRAELIRQADQQILWSERYAEGAKGRSLTEIEDEISSRIASVVGQQYGLAMQDHRDSLKVARSDPSVQGFACVARAQIYRRTYRTEEYQAARDCLEETVRKDPDYVRAWAMLAYLRNDATRFGHDTARTREAGFDHAREAALRALDLDPNDTDALQAMSHIEQYSGDMDRSIDYARRAVEVNPNDPAAVANLGIRYHIHGRYDLAVPLMRQAIELSVSPPPFYFHVLAADHLIKQEWDDMLSAAQRASLDGWSFGQAMLAIAHNELSHGRAAAAALGKLAELDPVLSETPRVWLDSHQASPALLEAIVAGLARVNAAQKNELP